MQTNQPTSARRPLQPAALSRSKPAPAGAAAKPVPVPTGGSQPAEVVRQEPAPDAPDSRQRSAPTAAKLLLDQQRFQMALKTPRVQGPPPPPSLIPPPMVPLDVMQRMQQRVNGSFYEGRTISRPARREKR